MVMRYSMFLVLGGIFMLSCNLEDGFFIEEDPVEHIKTFSGVNEELWPYYQRFEEEGRFRGLAIDLEEENINGFIKDINQDHVLGKCLYRSYTNNEITIDQGFWNSASDLFKEFVVFHELGHCYLLRDHEEGAIQNGLCASIMRSGTGRCRDQYNFSTRSYYLDELFSKNHR
jgi:hypothetical protein